MPERIDITGNQYGRLTVIGFSHSKSRRSYWKCRCTCGKEKVIYGGSLKNGDTLSCGCLGKEHRTQSITKHGMTKTKLYRVWSNMLSRCYIESSSRYYRYGARGITVCDEWRNSFEAFYSWAMANGYTENLTIDRKDVNGNYEPDNCRWATRKEQMNNYSGNRHLEYNGMVKTVAEWAEVTGLNVGTIRSRLKNGWSAERALTEKPYIGRNQYS